jgi:hypothetical protein
MLNGADSPPCITARRGGCVINKCREATEADAAGVVFLSFTIGKPPRPRYQRRLRGILLIARPPLLAVMQGGELRSIHHRARFTIALDSPSRSIHHRARFTIALDSPSRSIHHRARFAIALDSPSRSIRHRARFNIGLRLACCSNPPQGRTRADVRSGPQLVIRAV